MKKNEIYQGKVMKLKFPNKGVVEVEGEEDKVIVKNVLPGQVVSFRLTKNKTNKKEGRLIEVVEASEVENQVPPCPHFGECGGCSYQSMSYDRQTELKLSQVRELLTNVVPDIKLDTCVESPDIWEYRNKMEFSFGDEIKDGPLTLGLHKKGSFYDIVPVKECRIVHEDIRKCLATTLNYFAEKNISYYHKMSHEGYLRHLLVRRSRKNQEIMLCLVTTSQIEDDDELISGYSKAIQELDLQGSLAGILHMTNDGLADMVRADKIDVLYGADYFYEEILGLKFKITPFSFFQTNSYGAEKLYSIAREYLGDEKKNVVFDLYSGTGTISQIIAPVAGKVIGVEIVEEAVEAAKENAKLNKLDNVEFIADDVLKALDNIADKPDYIILDPPREGVHPKALRKILEYGVEKMIYISCKPTSLARDLEMFIEYGYYPEKAVCVDMFPWTRGVETVCLLSRSVVK
ncbi:23S rRNA (uracil(1939)-C(5))-methyltransferase RlmD [Eubacterium xylanophilum]|uniref:23S rRNA (uracil(1939)-C(5))-methyltransferase RlmD n=1 Tax=Eubacterium xylanophilum TaxID=39497 RepID=UPI000478AE86|nr:23S rRNA (uracil(1939)-C(5))-methyltransferase RlmD [Eubacterium xylanophilum]